MLDTAYNDTNREILRAKKRAWYFQHRDEVLKRQRADKRECPLCTICYRRLYLKTHLENRHKLSEEQIAELLS